MKNLAIVIPAYKTIFLRQTLDSILRQENKNFRVYIGDDCSPYEIQNILDDYKNKLDITYKRFKNNLGGTDLVAQWNRCIEMVGEEEWVWLFSDDDIMDPNCVEQFYFNLSKDQNQYSLYRFDLQIINAENCIINESKYPVVLKSLDYLKRRLRGQLSSYVVEFIFYKPTFFSNGGFEHFELAWNSDFSTWLKISKQHGIRSIKNACVQWRSSGYNISPNNGDLEIVSNKITANLKFSKWLKTKYFNRSKINFVLIYPHLATWFIVNLSLYKGVLSEKEIKTKLKCFFKSTNTNIFYPIGWLYFKKL